MDEGRGGGCSFDIEAAMAQVVAAGRQSLKEEGRLQPWSVEAKMEAAEQEQAAQESLAALKAVGFAQRRVVLKLKGRFYSTRLPHSGCPWLICNPVHAPPTPHCRWCCLLRVGCTCTILMDAVPKWEIDQARALLEPLFQNPVDSRVKPIQPTAIGS